MVDRVREAIRARHYSRRTEKTYAAWIRRYILFHGKRHPAEMGPVEITQFLNALALKGKVAASTQNQALSALLFLYREVLGQDLPWLDSIARAKRPDRLPVVLTRAEVRAVIDQLYGVPRLMGLLLYGAGLRLLECARLRVKDIDFVSNQIVGDTRYANIWIRGCCACNTASQPGVRAEADAAAGACLQRGRDLRERARKRGLDVLGAPKRLDPFRGQGGRVRAGPAVPHTEVRLPVLNGGCKGPSGYA